MGTFFIWFFTTQGQGKSLTAPQAIPTIQAFITGAAAHGDVAANITSWRVTLH